ncbi:hypothetical protein B0H13DRAFT_2556207 [Mycena leptocephala]|nr:hypothetical protein B0H13DRAFT_2556207 [Mycena leptocephala]
MPPTGGRLAAYTVHLHLRRFAFPAYTFFVSYLFWSGSIRLNLAVRYFLKLGGSSMSLRPAARLVRPRTFSSFPPTEHVFGGPSMRACALSPLAFPELWQPPSAQRIVDVVSPGSGTNAPLHGYTLPTPPPHAQVWPLMLMRLSAQRSRPAHRDVVRRCCTDSGTNMLEFGEGRAHRLMLECEPLKLMNVVLKSGPPMTIVIPNLNPERPCARMSKSDSGTHQLVRNPYHTSTAVQAPAGCFRQRPLSDLPS